MKRSGKFYRKNEAEVMESLGLKPTKNSGSGWVEKEDGQSEEVICQLKSTDAESIRIHKKDLDTLSYNAAVAHKLPVFAIQFLQSNEVYLILKPEVLQEVSEYIKTGCVSKIDFDLSIGEEKIDEAQIKPRKMIQSGSRDKFHQENELKYRKGSKSAL